MSRRVHVPATSYGVQALVWAKRPAVWLIAALVLAGAGLFWYYSAGLIELLGRAEQARAWIASFGPLAPLVYILLNIAQVVIAPFPGNFMGVASGYLFGMLWGTIYSTIGLLIGATLAVSIGRFFGRPLLLRFFSADQVRVWEGKLRIRSPLLWSIIFLFPVPDVVIYVAGLSSMPLRWLLPAIIAGRSIGITFANVVGGWSAKLPPEWLLVKWSILALLALLVYEYQRTIRLMLLLGYRRGRRLIRRRAWTTQAVVGRPAATLTPCPSESTATDAGE